MRRASFELEPTSIPPMVFTLPEAAAALRYGRSALLREIAEGRIKTIRNGRRVLVPRSECEAWIAAKLKESEVGPR